MLAANAPSLSVVTRVCARNAGNARIVAASAASRLAVVANSWLVLRTKPCNWAGELDNAENTWPPSCSNVEVADCWRCSTASTELTLVANGYSSAKAALNCWPRLLSAMPPCCIQVANAARVLGSNVLRI